MKVDLYNQKAKKVGDVDIKDGLIVEKINPKVISQYVYIYLSNQREGNASTKDKSEVSGGGRKPFKQKGTGRARAGSNRSPIWKGGGVTFGPTSSVNWKRKTTKSFRASAIRNVLSHLITNNQLKVVEKFNVEGAEKLTKSAVEMMKNFGVSKKMLIVTAEKNDTLVNSFANISKSNVTTVQELNAYELLNGGTVLLEKEALDYIEKHWAK
jgi:large subunit ribosomal protein L4